MTNVAWAFTGNTYYALCQWGMLVALSRLGSPVLVGQYALGLAIASPLFLFAGLQVRSVQVTDVAGQAAFSDYLGLRLASVAAALLAIVAFLAIAGYRGEAASVVLAVALTKAFEAVSDVYHGDLQRRERMGPIAFYLALKGTLSMLALAIGVKLTGRASVGALAMALVFALVLLFGEARFVVPGARPRWNPATIRHVALTALPLGAAIMLISLNANMPRYFVEHSWGAASLGVFAALSYLSIAGSTVVNAIGQAALPRLAQCWISRGRAGFTPTLAAMGAVAAALGLGGFSALALWGRPLLTFVYGPVYAERLDVALWVMAGSTILYVASVMGYGLTSARCFKPQLPLFGAVTASAALACVALVPRYGLVGAAAAQAVAAAVQLAAAAAILWWHMGRPASAPAALAEAVS